MAKILVIDDDSSLRAVISKGLRLAGHEVLEAENGAKGLALARRDHPDLVVTDMMMQEQEGIQTIIELRADGNLPIIAMSGFRSSAGFSPLDDAVLLGADVVLAKPFSLKELVEAAEGLLERDQGS